MFVSLQIVGIFDEDTTLLEKCKDFMIYLLQVYCFTLVNFCDHLAHWSNLDLHGTVF